MRADEQWRCEKKEAELSGWVAGLVVDEILHILPSMAECGQRSYESSHCN